MARKQQICWLGLGNMGRGMCKNLVEKGNLQAPLILYNRTRKRADELSAAHKGSTSVASTIADAVAPSDIIFTCVGDDAAVQETIDAALSAGNVEGKLFVECSTIHPDTTNAIHKKLSAKGAHFVAMPVFGAPAMAYSGNLVCVLAGSKEDVDRVKPFTKGVLGWAIIDLSGQDPGKATLLKVIGNTFVLNMIESLAEGLVLSEKTGLGVDNLHQFIAAVFPGPYESCSTRMRTGDYHTREEPLFAVDLARKDAGHAMKLAEQSGCRMRDVEVADKHLEAVKAHQGKTGDIASVYGAVRQESGLKYEVD